MVVDDEVDLADILMNMLRIEGWVLARLRGLIRRAGVSQLGEASRIRVGDLSMEEEAARFGAA
jgi:hypothetical protein